MPTGARSARRKERGSRKACNAPRKCSSKDTQHTSVYMYFFHPKQNSVCAFRAQEFSAAHLCRHACCTYVRSCTALKSKAARKFVHDSIIWSKSTNMSFSSAEKQDNRFFFRSSNPRFLTYHLRSRTIPI